MKSIKIIFIPFLFSILFMSCVNTDEDEELLDQQSIEMLNAETEQQQQQQDTGDEEDDDTGSKTD